MELADYVDLLRKRWRWIAAVAAAGLVSAFAFSMLSTPVYSATAQVFVSVSGTDTTADLVQGSTFTTKQVASYAQLVDSPSVLDPVIADLGLEQSAGELAEQVTAQAPLDTVLINITADDPSAELSAAIANGTAESLAATVAAIEKPSTDQPSPVRISTVRSAVVPDAAVSPNTPLNLAIGLLVGLALGFGTALLRERMDTRIRTQDDVRAVTDTAIIGSISYDESAADLPLIVQESPRSARSEAFRRLRTNLQFLALDRERRAIVITSAIPGEGKSTTAINMAISLADAGTKVVLVDADLRRPTVSKYMGLEGATGLTTVLIGKVAVEDAIQEWGNPNLRVLASGQIPPNPSELLGSLHMAELIQKLGSEYDVVLIDTAPLLPVTDGAILARLAAGAVVVVGAGTTHRPQVEEALEALSTVGANVLGIVANRLPMTERGGYYRYEYQYQPQQTPEPKPARGWGAKHRRKYGWRGLWDTAFPGDDAGERGGRTAHRTPAASPVPSVPPVPQPPAPPPAERVPSPNWSFPAHDDR